MRRNSSTNHKHPTTDEFRVRKSEEATPPTNRKDYNSRTASRKEHDPRAETEEQQAQTSSEKNGGNTGDAVGAAVQEEVVVYDSFETMGLRQQLLRGVYAFGFEKPSAIQQRAIVPCLQGRDVIVQGQSGTGKTATFTIGLLQQIDLAVNKCQVMYTSRIIIKIKK